MKRLTMFLTVIIGVLSLSWPSFAGKFIENVGRSPGNAEIDNFTGKINQEEFVSGNILGISIDPQKGSINVVSFEYANPKNYGLAPAWGQTGEINPVPLKDSTSKNYGHAPDWGKVNENSWGERMLQNQSLEYLFDNSSN